MSNLGETRFILVSLNVYFLVLLLVILVQFRVLNNIYTA